MKTIKTFISLLFVMLALTNADAEMTLVDPLDLTAAVSTEHGSRPAIAAINGAGLTGGTHSISNADMWSANGFISGSNFQFFKIKINSARDIDSLHIWNGNWGTTYRTRGVKYFDIYYANTASDLSLDDTIDASWTFLRSDSLEMASGTTSEAGEAVDVSDIPSDINWIALKINEGHGGGLAYAMLSEIQLYETPSEVENLGVEMTAPASVMSGATANISFLLEGTAPWDLTYSFNGVETTVNGISTSPYAISPTLIESAFVKVESLSDATTSLVNGDSAMITAFDGTLNPVLDGMVRESTTDLFSLGYIELKNSAGYSREGVFSFNISNLDSVTHAEFGLYLYSPTSGISDVFTVYGISQSEYAGKVTTWADIQSYTHIDSSMSVAVSDADVNKYVTIDISSYLNKCIVDGDSIVNLLLKATNGTNLYKLKMTENGSNIPEIKYAEYDEGVATSIVSKQENNVEVQLFPNPAIDQINIVSRLDFERMTVYNLQGQTVLSPIVMNNNIDLTTLESGSYILRLESDNQVFVRKFIKQ